VPMVIYPFYICWYICTCEDKKSRKILFSPAPAAAIAPKMVAVPLDSLGRAKEPEEVVLDRSPTKINLRVQDETPLNHLFS